jgi:hypothetical protein
MSANEWEIMTTKIIKAIDKIEPLNQREMIIKIAVMMYLYKSLQSEETFNNNCEILNNISYEEMRLIKR